MVEDSQKKYLHKSISFSFINNQYKNEACFKRNIIWSKMILTKKQRLFLFKIVSLVKYCRKHFVKYWAK